MRCLGPTPHCQRTAPCEHACALRVTGIPPVGPSDSQMLDWLENWHDVKGKPHGYGETGIAIFARVSDGFMVDAEFGGGIYDTLREAIRAAMKKEAPDA